MEEYNTGLVTHIARMLFIAIVTVVGLIILTVAIYGLSLYPDQAAVVHCYQNCSVGSSWFGNTTFNVECLQNQSQPQYNGTCYIHRTLIGTQNVTNTEGPCDVRIACENDCHTNFQDMKYPVTISVLKVNDTFKVAFNVANPKGEAFFNWSKPIDVKDTIDLKNGFDFICPHEVITDVNMQTCSEYLDPILGEQNPMIYALATGQNECSKSLINCTAKVNELQASDDRFEFKYIDMSNMRDATQAKLDECTYDLSNPEGSCSTTFEENRVKLQNQVNLWMIIAAVLGVFLAILVYYETLGGGEFAS